MFDITPPIPELRYSDSVIRLERSLGTYGGYILDKMLSPELLLIPTMILLAVIVGFLPAVTAYKTLGFFNALAMPHAKTGGMQAWPRPSPQVVVQVVGDGGAEGGER